MKFRKAVGLQNLHGELLITAKKKLSDSYLYKRSNIKIICICIIF